MDVLLAALVRTVNVPPFGMASTALKIRFMSASRISLSMPAIAGRSSTLHALLDYDAALLRHIAPTGASEIHDLLDQAAQMHGRQGQLRLGWR